MAPNCGDGSKQPIVSSMLDTAMGEGSMVADEVALAVERLRNIREGIEAPTQDNPVPALKEVFGPEKVLDFTGDVDGGGIKMSMYDDYVTKPPLELVPQALTRAAARALGYGAIKYAPNNWRRGIRWGEVFGALKRHLDAWNEGEDLDSKEDGGSGLNHLDHAAACLGFLTHMVGDERYKKMDDRP